ncbi:VOC family protein [Calidifontibacillus oryziterrae]|uniref:VOC family protein n=1 Tax=Calidifontibacillus oryziterrae TaxID=1191699 RepID=UPI0002E68B36|nr:VOC family protein [Calidifontibacillus oryziterrae]
MALNIYISFNGNCLEAVNFYADVFETETPRLMTFGDAPPNPESSLPDEAKNLIMHAEMYITGSRIMFSDTFPGTPFQIGNNVTLAVIHDDIDKIKAFFQKLKEDGTVEMELQETFWSKCYGIVQDKFGITWQLSYESSET